MEQLDNFQNENENCLNYFLRIKQNKFQFDSDEIWTYCKRTPINAPHKLITLADIGKKIISNFLLNQPKRNKIVVPLPF